jgi:hypothetical protein
VQPDVNFCCASDFDGQRRRFDERAVETGVEASDEESWRRRGLNFISDE